MRRPKRLHSDPCVFFHSFILSFPVLSLPALITRENAFIDLTIPKRHKREAACGGQVTPEKWTAAQCVNKGLGFVLPQAASLVFNSLVSCLFRPFAPLLTGSRIPQLDYS